MKKIENPRILNKVKSKYKLSHEGDQVQAADQRLSYPFSVEHL